MVEINQKIKDLLEKKVVALSTIGSDFEPNVIAVSFPKVVDRNKIVITDNLMNKTKENVLRNKKVSIAVWNENPEIGYQLKGEAEYLTDGSWKNFVDIMDDNEGFAHKAAIVITVHEIWDLVVPHLVCKED